MIKLKTAIKYIFLIIVSLISVFPLYWMAVSATHTSIEVIRGALLPGNYLFKNFANLLAAGNVSGAMANSFKYSIVMTVLALFICSLAGYGFEIYHDKAKDAIMSVLLLAMMVPFVAIMIPLFQTFSKWGLLNTTLGFLLPTISTPFLIMLFRQSARSFPHDILEAARLDGLNEFHIFLRIFVPTMKSTYASAAIITFMGAWNSYSSCFKSSLPKELQVR